MPVVKEANRNANLEDIEEFAEDSLRQIKADINKRGEHVMNFSNKPNFKKISSAYTKIINTLCAADKPLTEDEQRISAKYKATVEELEEKINRLPQNGGSGRGSRTRRHRRGKRHTRSKN